MAVLKVGLAALAVAISHVSSSPAPYGQSENVNASLPLGQMGEGLCEVFTVVESETVVKTCVSTPAVIVVDCTTINLAGPTCIDTTLTVSSTLTEGNPVNGQYIAGQTESPPATGEYAPPYYGGAQATQTVQVQVVPG